MLVTLTVLGIIASIVVPPVFRRYQEAIERTKIKKAMRVYDFATVSAFNENDIKSLSQFDTWARGENGTYDNSIGYYKALDREVCKFRTADNVYWNLCNPLEPIVATSKKALEDAEQNGTDGRYSFGLTFSMFLLDSGCKVYEFNVLSTAKARKALSVDGTKNDMGDAKVISIFANHTNLQEVSTKTVKLKQLLTKRKLLVVQRTQIINNLKSSFNQLGIIVPFRSFSTLKASKWFLDQNDICIREFCKLLLSLNESIKILNAEIERLLPEQAKKLTTITGINTLTAGTIYAETKGKEMSKSQFASYCGVAPVDCSSGQTQRHRNNHRGNRIPNSILYSVATNQIRFDKIGSEYYLKKLHEGKAKKVARKHLQRQLSNLIWKTLFQS